MSILAKIALGTTALVAMGSTAMAADLMAPPPPAAAMTSDWTGGYIGVGGTYIAWPSPDQVGQIDVIAGANLQTDMFLVGLQGWLGAYHDMGPNSNGWEGGAEGRVGFVAGSTAAVYGSLGAQAYSGGARYWTAGLGVEFMVSDSTSLDLEYKHYWQACGGLPDGNSITGALLWHFH